MGVYVASRLRLYKSYAYLHVVIYVGKWQLLVLNAYDFGSLNVYAEL